LKRRVVKEAREEQQKQKSFLGSVVSIYTIISGLFYLIFPGNFIFELRPYGTFNNERIVAIAMVGIGFIKLVGILKESERIKRMGIICLSILWGGLFVVSVTYSFGIGYPSPIWIDRLFILVLCVKMAFRYNGGGFPWKK